MEPRPPKPPRNPVRRPDQPPSRSSWTPPGQQPAASPPGDPRYAPQQPPAYPPYGQGGGYEQPGYGQAPPPPPGYGRPSQPPPYGSPGYGAPPPATGYGQQPPPDPYAGYGTPPGYGQAPQGTYPGGSDPYRGYGQPGYGQPQPGGYPPTGGQPPAQSPEGARSAGGWIAPLPDEQLAANSQAGYGGYRPPASRPPVVNRRTQIVAALAIGGLALMILAIVVGFIIFGGDDGKGENRGAALAATQTSTALLEAATAQATATTAPEPPTVEPTVDLEASAHANATATAQVALETAAAETATGPMLYNESVSALLPTEDDLPAGYVQTQQDQLQRADVAAALGDEVTVEQQLRDMAWRENWFREFQLPPDQADPDRTQVLYVSIHRFRTLAGAEQALPFFVQKGEELNGYTAIDGPAFGDQSVTMTGTSSEGGTIIVIYALKDNLLFRVYGYSMTGDPTGDVQSLLQNELAKLG